MELGCSVWFWVPLNLHCFLCCANVYCGVYQLINLWASQCCRRFSLPRFLPWVWNVRVKLISTLDNTFILSFDFSFHLLLLLLLFILFDISLFISALFLRYFRFFCSLPKVDLFHNCSHKDYTRFICFFSYLGLSSCLFSYARYVGFYSEFYQRHQEILY